MTDLFFNMLPMFLSLAFEKKWNALNLFIYLFIPPVLNGDISHLPDTTALGGHLLEDFRTKSLNPHGVVIAVFDWQQAVI